jgi:hypothetical protein
MEIFSGTSANDIGMPKIKIIEQQDPGLKNFDVEKSQLGQYGTFDPRSSTSACVKREATKSILLAFLASLLAVTLFALVGIVGVGVFWY